MSEMIHCYWLARQQQCKSEEDSDARRLIFPDSCYVSINRNNLLLDRGDKGKHTNKVG